MEWWYDPLHAYLILLAWKPTSSGLTLSPNPEHLNFSPVALPHPLPLCIYYFLSLHIRSSLSISYPCWSNVCNAYYTSIQLHLDLVHLNSRRSPKQTMASVTPLTFASLTFNTLYTMAVTVLKSLTKDILRLTDLTFPSLEGFYGFPSEVFPLWMISLSMWAITPEMIYVGIYIMTTLRPTGLAHHTRKYISCHLSR